MDMCFVDMVGAAGMQDTLDARYMMDRAGMEDTVETLDRAGMGDTLNMMGTLEAMALLGMGKTVGLLAIVEAAGLLGMGKTMGLPVMMKVTGLLAMMKMAWEVVTLGVGVEGPDMSHQYMLHFPDSLLALAQQQTPARTPAPRETAPRASWPELSGSSHPELTAATDSSYLVLLALPEHAGT